MLLKSPFKQVYMHSSAGDAGVSFWAIYTVWHELGGARSPVHGHAHCGQRIDNDQIGQVLQA